MKWSTRLLCVMGIGLFWGIVFPVQPLSLILTIISVTAFTILTYKGAK